MEFILSEGQLNNPVDVSVLADLSMSVDFEFPTNYIEFLKKHDGGEGFIGENYIIFWKAEELVDFNREYEVEKYAPGIFLFASDGAGEGYGFDTENKKMPIIRLPFVGMYRQYANPVADDICSLFSVLSEQK
ncbi:SMI1/KNR4 family protein [Pseudomonas sp. PA1(2017)]|uniref:SMI1/KNR4 family protein n=1 Tax=Pseudomonas sp. PA1(2017) TaxID=1932113 RepID=UPI00096513DA|nr:SMI1/KNR4 family protein [Pseudomonas sp. PA1(2017)]OLU16543.1 SMI1/KNR4 family protein [Pseudomonas sp. PA1(2017)]